MKKLLTILIIALLAFFPALAASEGKVHAVWYDDSVGGGEILYARSTEFDESFSAAVNLSGTSGASIKPAIFASGDDVYLVWEQWEGSSAGNSEIFFRKSDDGGDTFTPSMNVSNTSEFSGAPDIGVADGTVYIVWGDTTPGNAEILFAKSIDGGDSFGAPVNISNQGASEGAPRIAVLGSKVYVVWHLQVFTPNFEIQLALSVDSGDSFAPPVNLSNNLTFSHSPDIATSSEDVYVVWRDNLPDEPGEIFLRRSTGGGGAFSASILVSSTGEFSHQPTVATADGNVYVAWRENTEVNGQIFFSASEDGGDTFASPTNVSSNGGLSEQPRLATSDFTVYLAWTDDSPGNNDILLTQAIACPGGAGVSALAEGSCPLPPVVFVPGVAGSVLIDRGQGDSEMWLGLPTRWHELSLFGSGAQDILASAALRAAVETEWVAFTPTGPITIPVVIQPIYGPFLDFMAEAGYEEYNLNDASGRFDPQRMRPGSSCNPDAEDGDPNLFVFPYDWRRDNAGNAVLLREYIQCVRRFYPGQDVNIVAHSMGGLLSRQYLLQNPTDHHVANFISIASPYLGAPKLIYTLETGDFLDKDNNLLGRAVNTTFKDIIGSFKGGHQLLPSRKYYEMVRDGLARPPLAEDDRDLNMDGEFEQLSFNQMKAVVDSLYGRPGFRPGTNTDAFHQGGQDDWGSDTPGINYFHIVGVQSGDDTIEGAVSAFETNCVAFGLACTPEAVIKLRYTQGDHTVPTISAKRKGGFLDYNAPGATITTITASQPSQNDSVDHNGLMSNTEVHDLVLQYLQHPAASVASTEVEAAAVSHPYNYVTVSGAESLTVEDSAGNTTGAPFQLFGSSIPGVSAYTLGENTSQLNIPTSASQDYELFFEVGDRPISVEIRVGTGDTTTRSVRYRDVMLPEGADVQLSLTPDGPQALAYDADGDGTFEGSVSPTVDVSGEDAGDQEGPVITITETTKGATSSLVSLSAVDEGSGVGVLFYSLDGSRYQEYTGPFVADPTLTPTLYAFVDDLVANRSTLVHPLTMHCNGVPATHVGTPLGETILGTVGNDSIVALDGDDVIFGLGGDDTICAGTGDDHVWTTWGSDWVFGDVGDDIIRTGSGDDMADGGPGNDHIFTSNGNDEALGGDGNDILSAGSGNDMVLGGPGDDVIYSGDGGDVVSGDDGDDRIYSGSGTDAAFGNAGDDVITCGSGVDLADGGPGTDLASIDCETQVSIP